jgi:hypothetical protein
MHLYKMKPGGNVMKKLITTLLIGLPLLAASSMAQAHGSYNGGIRGSIGISIPLDNGGYLELGAGPSYYPQSYYYPAPYVRSRPGHYVRSGYARGYGYSKYRNGYGHNDGRRHGDKHHRGKARRHHSKNDHDNRWHY